MLLSDEKKLAPFDAMAIAAVHRFKDLGPAVIKLSYKARLLLKGQIFDNFFVFAKIFANNGVRVVNDYADMCPRSQLLCGHRVRVVVDYVDTRFSNFASEYLRENENFCETVFACSYGAQVESFKPPKIGRNSRDTVPLKVMRKQQIFFIFPSGVDSKLSSIISPGG